MSENSGFTSEGHRSFANSYEDNKRVGEFSSLNDAALEYKVREYEEFVTRDDIMPRARTAASRILNHLGFEIGYRSGIYHTQTLEAANNGA
ncbi:MAG TPA: hypothetical protein VFL85_01670 [Candidatus Saccharimonadales bacterium]|nr:hypothetical protein [Candidatus Saccharimonadales bacterium]